MPRCPCSEAQYIGDDTETAEIQSVVHTASGAVPEANRRDTACTAPFFAAAKDSFNLLISCEHTEQRNDIKTEKNHRGAESLVDPKSTYRATRPRH